jgi:AcrR family transcriptional regulator
MATKAGLDRQGIIQTAAELADSTGLHEVTLATLATRLGIRTPTLYHYFDGLAGLRRELALLGCRQLAQHLGKAIMGKAGEEAVAAMAHAYRTFVKEHPGLYAATVQAAPLDDTEMREVQNEVLDIVIRTLSGYRLEDEEAIHVVRILRSFVHGFATLESSGGFGIPVSLDETFERLIKVFLRGTAP